MTRNANAPVLRLTKALRGLLDLAQLNNLAVSLPETGDGLESIARIDTRVASVCADGQKLHASRESDSQTNDQAASPVPQKVNTRTGVGARARVASTARWTAEHGRPNVHRAERSRANGSVPLGSHWSCWPVARRPRGAVARVRGADTSRPGAPVMRRAATWPTRVLRPSGTIVPTPDQCPDATRLHRSGAGRSAHRLPSGTATQTPAFRTER